MKKIITLFVFCGLMLSGCIRHTDQPFKKKYKGRSTEERINFRRVTPRLLVADVNKTIAFYKEVFGFEPVYTVPDTGVFSFAILSRGSIELMIQNREELESEVGQFQQVQTGGTFVINFEVTNILSIYEKASTFAHITKELHQTFHGTKEFAVKENNGYIFVFSEPMKK